MIRAAFRVQPHPPAFALYMDAKQARAILACAEGVEVPIFIPSSVLLELTINDLSEDVAIEVGTEKDYVVELEWEGPLYPVA